MAYKAPVAVVIAALVGLVLVAGVIGNAVDPHPAPSPDTAPAVAAPSPTVPQASSGQLDLSKPISTKDDAVGCDSDEALQAYQLAMAQFDFKLNDRLENGEVVRGCSVLNPQDVLEVDSKDGHIEIVPDKGSSAGWDGALWVSLLDLRNR